MLKVKTHLILELVVTGLLCLQIGLLFSHVCSQSRGLLIGQVLTSSGFGFHAVQAYFWLSFGYITCSGTYILIFLLNAILFIKYLNQTPLLHGGDICNVFVRECFLRWYERNKPPLHQTSRGTDTYASLLWPLWAHVTCFITQLLLTNCTINIMQCKWKNEYLFFFFFDLGTLKVL